VFKKLRVHNQYYEYSKLKTWSLARCRCGKFLAKHRRFCDVCRTIARKNTESKRYFSRREEAILRSRIAQNTLKNINVGDKI
jgi:hypothetical protein